MRNVQKMSDQPKVPKGVLRGIEDIAQGKTVTAEEMDEVLNYDDE